jgi:hypothetical protein
MGSNGQLKIRLGNNFDEDVSKHEKVTGSYNKFNKQIINTFHKYQPRCINPMSDPIGSDDPTKSYRIPGDVFTPDSVRQIYQNLSNVPNFTSSRFSYTREHPF